MTGERAMRLAVLASGRGSNLQAIMDAIASGQVRMELALVASDQPGARALTRASDDGVPTDVVAISGDGPSDAEALLGCFEDHRVDVMALAGFMRILPAEFLAGFPGAVFNIHPSLLPAFPGLNAQEQALSYGVKVSGCTVHFVDEGVDTGPIILQAAVPVFDDDDEQSLSERILRREHRIYPRALQLYAEGRVLRSGRKVRIIER